MKCYFERRKILTQGTPTAVIETLNGSIWTKIIDREALEENEKTSMLSNYNQDNTLNIRVHSAEKPNESFVAAIN
jgi:hypothetical protein